MSQRNIILKVKLALGVIIALLVFEDVFAWWIDRHMEGIQADVSSHERAVTTTTDRVRHNLSQVTGSLSLLLLDAKNDSERKHLQDIRSERTQALTDLESSCTSQPTLADSFQGIREFEDKTFHPLEDQIARHRRPIRPAPPSHIKAIIWRRSADMWRCLTSWTIKPPR